MFHDESVATISLFAVLVRQLLRQSCVACIFSKGSYCGLCYDILQLLDRLPTFRRNILPPSSTLSMEAVCSSEMFVLTYNTTWCDNPEDHNNILHCRENAKSHILTRYSDRVNFPDELSTLEKDVNYHLLASNYFLVLISCC
jgi:hypothetical protein